MLELQISSGLQVSWSYYKQEEKEDKKCVPAKFISSYEEIGSFLRSFIYGLLLIFHRSPWNMATYSLEVKHISSQIKPVFCSKEKRGESIFHRQLQCSFTGGFILGSYYNLGLRSGVLHITSCVPMSRLLTFLHIHCLNLNWCTTYKSYIPATSRFLSTILKYIKLNFRLNYLSKDRWAQYEH